MKYISSLITVEDINISRKFYEEVMEQTVVNDFGENVSFNGFAIHLKSHYKKLIDKKEITNAGSNFELYFEHNNIEQFVEKLKNNKIKFVHELREQPWKQKVVRVYDPDNYIVEIGEPM